MPTALLVIAILALVGALIIVGHLGRQIAVLEKMLRALLDGKPPEMRPTFPPALERSAALVHKITERHGRIERGFTQDRLELEAILANMAEGLLVVNERHVIRRVNTALCQLFGLTNSPVGQTVLIALREAPVEEMVRAALENEKTETREITMLRGSHAPRHLVVNAAPVHGPAQGAEREVVLVFHEITQLRQLEEVRRDFVANVSHELRTPLSIFQGYLEMLLDAPDQPRAERLAHLEIMRRNSVRLNALLEDLLTLARLEAGQEPLQLRPVPLEPLLARLADDWAAQFAAKKLTLAVELGPGVPSLHADEARLEQVLNNLLQNAVKFSRAEGTVAITTTGSGGEFVLSVRDDGIGIPPADLPHIFERFYRVEKARSRHAGGTGLGLAIVKHLMALHGGRVEAQSQHGHGTTIRLCFPPSSAATSA